MGEHGLIVFAEERMKNCAFAHVINRAPFTGFSFFPKNTTNARLSCLLFSNEVVNEKSYIVLCFFTHAFISFFPRKKNTKR